MLLFSSCNKKEKDKEIVQTEIAGKWIIKKEIFTETEDGEVKPETLTFSGNDSYIEFKDGMMKIVFLDDAEDQSWDIYTQPYTISSDSKKIVVSCINEDECFTENTTVEIRKLDSKNLVLYFIDTEIVDGTNYKWESEVHCVRP